MKTVNVFVCIQMDIPNQDEDQVSEVLQIVGSINESLFKELDGVGYAQILISDIDASNIIEQSEELEIDDEVEMPDPIDGDSWNFSFSGTIVNIRGEMADVEDMEGEVFSIELERLTKL